MVPSSLNDRFVIRFCVCAQKATESDIKYAYEVVSQFASDLITIMQMEAAQKRRLARMSTSASITSENPVSADHHLPNAAVSAVPITATPAAAQPIPVGVSCGVQAQIGVSDRRAEVGARHEPQITFAPDVKGSSGLVRLETAEEKSEVESTEEEAEETDEDVLLTEDESADEAARRDLQELSKEEEDSLDEVVMLDRKKKKSLRYKRSFFVRMVSDPKLYNPKIVRALSNSGQVPAHSRQTSNDSDTGLVTPLWFDRAKQIEIDPYGPLCCCTLPLDSSLLPLFISK